MLENFQGNSWGSIPPLRMPSLLPHDLCHEWNASLAPGNESLLFIPNRTMKTLCCFLCRILFYIFLSMVFFYIFYLNIWWVFYSSTRYLEFSVISLSLLCTFAGALPLMEIHSHLLYSLASANPDFSLSSQDPHSCNLFSLHCSMLHNSALNSCGGSVAASV